MDTMQKNAARAKDSTTCAPEVSNLQPVAVEDNTTTRGKVSAKFTLNDQAEAESKAEKIDKNALFAVDLASYFCPVRFDASEMEAVFAPLVEAGTVTEAVKEAAIEKARRDFMRLHAAEIEEAEKLDFAAVVAKLEARPELLKKVLAACKIRRLEKSKYIDGEGRVMIYRAAQSLDKDGKPRYASATLKCTEDGREFSTPLFVEYRPQTTSNILLAIRYYSSKQIATCRLAIKINEHRRLLSCVFETAKKAAAAGFTLEAVTAKVSEAFATESKEAENL